MIRSSTRETIFSVAPMPNRIKTALFMAFLTLTPACRQNVNSELLEVAKNGQTGQVKDLLVSGANVDTQAADGFTALKWAVVRGHTGTVQALLEAGADMNVRDKSSKTPLVLATEEDLTEIVELLKKAGATE
jgi:ankyrin repeat protein